MSTAHPPLDWPHEAAASKDTLTGWSHPGSNICLDFHGDPCRAKLVVFSDGNHHMALEECLQAFLKKNPDTVDIFYATTPPSVLLQLMKQGHIDVGNLRLSRMPDVFIGPQGILTKLEQDGLLETSTRFMQSRCNVMLVRGTNPKSIHGIPDLLRDGIKIFMSNPQTEKASYQVYTETIFNLAREQGLEINRLEQLFALESNNVVYGECIHHRELPQAIANGVADVAMVYYHLALRYTRIFPNQFKIIPLSGTEDKPQASPAHHITDYYAGVINPDNPLSRTLLEHLGSKQTTEIYTKHGLKRPDQDILSK